MWSLGATFAECFRPLKERFDDVDEWDDECNEEVEEDEQREAPPFIFLRGASPTRITSWRRLPLFNADRGDIGLAWSIFKVRGTPNETNWPVNPVNPYLVSVDLIVSLGLFVFASRQIADLRARQPGGPPGSTSTHASYTTRCGFGRGIPKILTTRRSGRVVVVFPICANDFRSSAGASMVRRGRDSVIVPRHAPQRRKTMERAWVGALVFRSDGMSIYVT